jgi:hypothetical protein
MCITRLKVYAALPFLLVLLAATCANALVMNTNADATAQWPYPNPIVTSSISDPKTATAGTILSAVPNDHGAIILPNWVIDDPFARAYASASDTGSIAVSAQSGPYYNQKNTLTAQAMFTSNIISSLMSFHITPGSLMIMNPSDPNASAAYSIDILNNGSTVWSSSGYLFNNGIHGVSGTDLGGSFSSAYSYSFGDYLGGVFVSAGQLIYQMNVTVSNGGWASIGDPFNFTGGFSASFSPVAGVPEPASAILFATGLLGFAGLRKRMKK